MTIRVVIVDDHTLVREGFRRLLESEPDIDVVAEAGDGVRAVAEAQAKRPDVVLMDIRMPALDGIEATRRITAHDPDIRVVILTTYDLDEYVYDAIRAGASGFLLKDSPPERLIEAVHVVAAGAAMLSPKVTRRLIEEFAQRPTRQASREFETLTGRERDVLGCLVLGQSNGEIADELFVSTATVKSHVGSLLMKLGLRDRVQAVIYAYEHGLVEPLGPAE